MCEGLITPASFRNASPAERAAVSNGCGPQSRFGGLVPDKLLGLSITCACDRHDWQYHHKVNKNVADRTFFANMCILIDKRGGPLRWPRRVLAWWYFRAVVRLGDRAYES